MTDIERAFLDGWSLAAKMANGSGSRDLRFYEMVRVINALNGPHLGERHVRFRTAEWDAYVIGFTNGCEQAI